MINLKSNIVIKLLTILLIMSVQSCKSDINKVVKYCNIVGMNVNSNPTVIFLPVKGCPCLNRIKLNPPMYFNDTTNYKIVLLGAGKIDSSSFSSIILNNIIYRDTNNLACKLVGVSKIFLTIVKEDSLTEYNAHNIVDIESTIYNMR